MVDELLLIIVDLRKEVNSLKAEIVLLKEEIHLLKNGKNSKRSHTSPSHDIGRSNTKSLRQKGIRPNGGQIGHEGKTLLMSEHPNEIKHYSELNYCKDCAHTLEDISLELIDKKQEIILPVLAPQIVEHRAYKKTCSHCGCENKSELPNHLVSSIQYGKCVEGFVAYLHAYQFLPMKRLRDLMNNVFQISISEGTIDNMLNRFALNAQPIYETIQNKVSQSNVIGSDETGSKIGSKKGWFHVWQTTSLTFIVASMNRGFSTVEKYFCGGFPMATIVSDCWAGQLKTVAKQHQLCFAHLLRELNNFIDALNDDWSRSLKILLEQAIQIKIDSYSTGLLEQKSRIDQIVNQLNKLLDLPDIPRHKKLNAFIKRLCKHRKSILVFLEIEDVPFDNNASERAIRNIKVKTKVSGCFRTFNGAERFAIIRSVTDTTIKNTQNVFEALRLLANIAAE